MDKIYSRRRIRIPVVRKNNKNNIKLNKTFKILLIIVIAIFTAYTLIKGIDPMFEALCIEEASNIATDIITEESAIALKKYNYQDIVSIVKSENTNILKTDVVVINNIATEITNRVVNRLKELENSNVGIHIGALTGSKFFSGSGPNIKIKIMPVGTVDSEIKTEFETQGINQTMYRIYLDIICEIKILMPYKNTSKKIKSQILLVETAIMGEVPETYYNLNGVTKDDSLNLMG